MNKSSCDKCAFQHDCEVNKSKDNLIAKFELQHESFKKKCQDFERFLNMAIINQCAYYED